MMVCNLLEQEELSFILEFRPELKFCVYPFDDGIVGHDVSSLELANTD